MKTYCARSSHFCTLLILQFFALSILLVSLALGSAPAFAAQLEFQDIPLADKIEVPFEGAGKGKRALYSKAGKVGGVDVDLVAKLITATRDHKFNVSSNRPSIEASALDDIWVDWYIYKSGTYNIKTDKSTNGASDLVEAEVAVQFSDLDGPNNEVLYIRMCTGEVDFVRISRQSTLVRKFGTVAGFDEVFSDAGDKEYVNTQFFPESGAEVFYHTASKFTMGRTAKNPYKVDLNNTSYTKADSFDLKCSDFRAPVATPDHKEAELGVPAVIQILDNDGVNSATGTFTPVTPATDLTKASVNLVAPAGATGIKKDKAGDTIGFTVTGQGTWSYDDLTGQLTFTPVAGFTGSPAPIEYTFKNATGAVSNKAKVTIATPRLEIVKTAVLPAQFIAGATITYAFKVSNPGSITFSGVTVTDTLPGIVIKGGPIALASGATDTTSFTAEYKLTQADIDAGKVVNTATATGTPPSGKPFTSSPSVVTTNIPKTPALTVVKTAGTPSGGTVGSTIIYTFTVTNSGNTTLTNVSVADTLPGIVLKGGPIASLAPGAADTKTFTAVYTLTQKDIDTGQVVNFATATGTPPGGLPPATSPPAKVTTKIDAAPALTVVKVAGTPSGSTVGSTIPYTFTVTNTGNVTLTNVSVADSLPGVVLKGGPIASLAPGAADTKTFTATYTLTQKDFDAGQVVNSATVTGTPPDGTPLTSVPSDVTAKVDAAPKLDFVKSADKTSVASVGEDILYTFKVTNSGNVTVKDIAVTDDKLVLAQVCVIAELVPAKDASCTGSYKVTQADLDAGGVLNVAVVTGNPPTGPPLSVTSNPVITPADAAPKLSVVKTAGKPSSNAAGATIDYTFNVRNEGNVTISNISVTDALPGVMLRGGPIVSLAPGQNDSTTFTATYILTQADINAGQAMNKATARGEYAKGTAGNRIIGEPLITTSLQEVTSPEVETRAVIDAAPGLKIVKTASAPSGNIVGSTVDYSFTVTNTGNVTLTNVSLTDDVLKVDLKGGPIASLEPGAVDTKTFTATYTLTQADIDAGQVINVATAKGTLPDGQPVIAKSNTATTTILPSPSLEVQKVSFSRVRDAGDEIDYRFTVTNTGNVTLTNVDIVDDRLVPAKVCTIAIVRVSLMTECTATYKVTQADIDSGEILNTATATGTPPSGPPVTGRSNTAVTEVIAAPSLTIVKTAGEPSGNKAGSVIEYSFTVTNTGNMTLTEVSVDDALFGGALKGGPIASLAPGEVDSTTFAATYELTQEDIDAGKVVNFAMVTGMPPNGKPLEIVRSNTVTSIIDAAPAVTIVKTAGKPSGNTVGSTIDYAFTVENTGNVTLTNISVTDSLPGAVLKGGPIASVAPGGIDATTFTATYTLTQKDVDAGKVVNTATVEGTPPDKDSPPVTGKSNEVTTDIDATPALAIVKVADKQSVSAVGESIGYTFTLTNTGNVTLKDLVVTDEKLIPAKVCTVAELLPSKVETCTGTYKVTQANLDAGRIHNSALVTANPPTGPPLSVTSDPVTTDVNATPKLSVVKTAGKPSGNAVGATIDYTFTVTNTGNVTLSGVSVADSLPGVNLRGGPIASLAPGAVDATTFTATYTLTQKDVDAGRVTNRATAQGIHRPPPIAGEPITTLNEQRISSPESEASVAIGAGPALTVVKTAGVLSGNAAGSTIPYTFAVTNTGNVTLTNVSVADELPGVVLKGGPIASLAPGGMDTTTFTAIYALTQKDVDAGRVVNTASVTGTPPVGDPLIVKSAEVATPIGPTPAIDLVMIASKPSGNRAGAIITFTFAIKNIGNVTLTNVSLANTLPGIVLKGGPIASLAPGEEDTKTYTATYTLTQADIEAGQVLNKAIASGVPPAGNSREPVVPATSPERQALTLIEAAPELSVVKTGHFNDENGNQYADADETITYRLVVTNKGNVPFNDMFPVDAGPVFNSHPAAGKLSAFIPGSSAIEPGGERIFTTTYTLLQADVDAAAGVKGGVINKAAARGSYIANGSTGIIYESKESQSVLDLPAAYGDHDVTINKQAGLRQIRRGEKAPFTIKVTNNNTDNVGAIAVTDILPSGFRYVEGSATVNGVAAVPIVNGRNTRFEQLTLGPKADVTIRLQMLALSTAEPGKHINRAKVAEEDGEILAPEATAAIEIMVDPVFDCGDVVGKVFDDLNSNGYQDDGEPGLPGVRIATVKGFLVTTDKHGRFHVACAELPDKRIGSNFIMKLDTRTLPTGYSVTTENPKVIRLTAGKMSKLSFAASIGHLVTLDLTDAAFEDRKTVLLKEWSEGLSKLIAILKAQLSTLRINYRATADRPLVDQRTDAIEEEIWERWKAAGGTYELNIETRVDAGQ